MNQVKFWVAIGQIEQLDFEGRVHIKDVQVGEVHIVYSEVLLCRQSRERLKNELKAKRNKVVSIRPAGKLCPKCEEKFRNHPDLAWAHWINPPEPRATEKIQINHLLVQNEQK